MKIIVSQQDKKILITFSARLAGALAKRARGGSPEGGKVGKVVDNYTVDKADDFIVAIDKFFKKGKIGVEHLKNVKLDFQNTGTLTERVVRAIMLGLGFDNKY